MGEVFVYRLIDPMVVVGKEAALRAHVGIGLGDRAAEPSFRLSPISGCFKAFDRARGRAPGRMPDSAEEVARAVVAYCAGVNRAAAEYRAARRLSVAEYPDPFPATGLRHISSTPVLGTSREGADRWRSLWMVFLPAEAPPAGATTGLKPVPVYGATVDVAVGPGGRILSVVSTVRPWIGVQRVPAYEAAYGSHGAAHRHERRAAAHEHPDEENASLFYVLDGPEEPQTFLAPYYIDRPIVEEHPHSTALRPACVHALIIDMTVVREGEGMRLVALVMGRGGSMAPADAREFRIDWRYGRLDEWLSGDVLVKQGPEVRVRLPGVYHIELIMTHVTTGAVRSTWRQIPIGAPPAERIA